jgi:Phosphotransferase enzyme family/RNA ligase
LPVTYPRLVFGTRFPAIPHLLGSATSSDADVVLSEEHTRDVLARVLVAHEKLDGFNVGLGFRRGLPVVHSRLHGVVPLRRLGPGFWPLVDYVFEHLAVLRRLLGDDTVLFGEWLEGVPTSLPYPRRKVPFVGFDLLDWRSRTFVPPEDARKRIARAGLPVTPELYRGTPRTLERLISLTNRSWFGGPAEGLVVTQGTRCFKFVRSDFMKPARLERPQFEKPPLPTPVRGGKTVRKTFAAGDDEVFQRVEVERLRALGPRGVAPTLKSVRGRTLELTRLPGRAWKKNESVKLAAALGASLAKVHSVASRLPLDSLADTSAAQLREAIAVLRSTGDAKWADELERGVLPLVRGLERELPIVPVVCHGDLKPEHVRVDGEVVRLLDFERSLRADRAWELGAAFERLGLSRAQRVALARGAGTHDGTVFLRAWISRIAWWAVQAVALRETTRSPSVMARSREGVRRLRELSALWRREQS